MSRGCARLLLKSQYVCYRQGMFYGIALESSPYPLCYTDRTNVNRMDKQVTIYSTPTCHFCQMTKEFLKERNVPYTEHNVASDLERRQEMIQKSGQMGVPVVLVDDEIIVGFDKQKLESLFPAA